MTFLEVHHLFKRGDLEGVRAALDAGTDPNLCNKNGCTLLMIAAGIGNTQIGKLLIERGANLGSRTHYPNSQDQWTALSYAAICGRPSFVGLLLDHGASLEASPFPGTFESYIDWLEKYSGASKPQLAKIRSIVSAARDKRTTGVLKR